MSEQNKLKCRLIAARKRTSINIYEECEQRCEQNMRTGKPNLLLEAQFPFRSTVITIWRVCSGVSDYPSAQREKSIQAFPSRRQSGGRLSGVEMSFRQNTSAFSSCQYCQCSSLITPKVLSTGIRSSFAVPSAECRRDSASLFHALSPQTGHPVFNKESTKHAS